MQAVPQSLQSVAIPQQAVDFADALMHQDI